jgi:hypothetical protein
VSAWFVLFQLACDSVGALKLIVTPRETKEASGGDGGNASSSSLTSRYPFRGLAELTRSGLLITTCARCVIVV